MSDSNETSTLADLHIRAACPSDVPFLVDFNSRLAAETEDTVLDREVLEAGVKAAVANPNRLRYWVAEHGGQVVGMSGVTCEWSDWRNGWLWWLQSVYVIPEVRGLGVFRALFHEIRGTARNEDVVGLRLYVEVENHRAKATYTAMGMQPGGYEVFEQIWPERFRRGE